MFLTLFFLVTLVTFGQTVISLTPIDIQVGASHFGIDTKSSSSTALSFGVSLNRLHFETSINGASGFGRYLDYTTSETYMTDKVNVMVFNFGYVIMPSDKFSIIPILGWGMSANIYQDTVAFDTYYNGDRKDYVNIGVIGKYYFGNFGIYGGVGTFERFKVGVSYRAW